MMASCAWAVRCRGIWAAKVVPACLVVLLGVVGPATAQEPDLGVMSLSDLMQIEIAPVFGASQRLQPVTEAPASVTIITAEDIARFGYRTLADILRSVRGFSVTYDRNYSYVGVRGFGLAGDYNSRILLLVDGHRMNDNIYDQAPVGAELGLDPRTFERVEVIRGPASSLYGANAFFGVVNIITKSGATLDGGVVSVEGASFGTAVAHAAVGRRLASGLDMAFFITSAGSDGPSRLYFPEFDSPESHDGIASGLDDQRFHQLFGRVNLGGLAIRGGFGSREKGVPTAAFETVFGDPRHRTTDRRLFADVEYARALGSTRVDLRAYAHRYEYEGIYPYVADDLVVVERDLADGIWWGLTGRVSRSVAGRHTLTAGGEVRHNVRQLQSVALIGEAPYVDARSSSVVLAAFAEGETRLRPWLLLNAGARYDDYRGFSHLAPRVGVIASTSPNQAFKYLYGNAFRAPNAYETNYYEVAADLEPETIQSHEVVWERYSASWLRTAVTAYSNHVDQLITFTSTAELFEFVNLGHARARGFEVEAEVRVASGVHGTITYAVQRTEDPDSGEELANSPRQLGGLRLSAPGPGGLIGALDLQYVGRRQTLSGAEVEPATLAHVTLRWPIPRGFTLTASVRNLFAERYADPASEEHLQDAIEQDGRTFRIGLDWRFRFE